MFSSPFTRLKHIVGALAAASVLALPAASHAATLFSTGFESPTYTTGNLIGQNGWESFPTGSTSTFSVVANGTNQYARAAGGAAEDTYINAFPVLDYTPAANELVSVNIDMARTQGASAATSSFAFGIDVYDIGGATEIARFGLASSQGSILAFVSTLATNGTPNPNGTASNLAVSNALTANNFYNLRGEFDFTAKTWSLYSGTSLVLGNMPFLDSSATGLGDADLFAQSATGATDAGFFDNYAITTAAVAVVPETNSLALLAVGALPIAGIVLARRRKKV